MEPLKFDFGAICHINGLKHSLLFRMNPPAYLCNNFGSKRSSYIGNKFIATSSGSGGLSINDSKNRIYKKQLEGQLYKDQGLEFYTESIYCKVGKNQKSLIKDILQ
ncbi:uncharacterized protein LOC124950469 [Vespa velutina]|uniref:uncharacterized protein LOC124950469 n=1 Tax=Vespa velutina TaxID=202808 RepID=UPI001FB45459|nr:uncharacterized protein LOC124950469 [Vespa velutina]